MTMPASVMPNMAVMWHREPLVDTLLNVIGDSEAVSVTAVPRFGSSSSEYTHWNLRDGCNPVFLKRRRSAAASLHPVTEWNPPVCMRVGSILRAAPIEE